MRVVTLAAIIVLLGFLMFGCTSENNSNNVPNYAENYTPNYTDHGQDNVQNIAPSPPKPVETYKGGPIFIKGDDEFTSANGVIDGSGTKDDPYVIDLAGWTIDASLSDTSKEPYVKFGIAISETSKYFVIKNCRVNDSDYAAKQSYGVGISLYSAENGRIENCTITGIHTGILPDGAYNITIADSTVENCEEGISTGTYSSDSIIVSNNTIMENGVGISFHYLQNSNAVNNTIGNNGVGVRMTNAAGSEISGNILQENKDGIDVSPGNWEGGKDNNVISYNIVSGTADNDKNSNNVGISVDGSYDTVTYNTVNGNDWGISIDGNNNTVSYNTANNNQKTGIWISGVNHVVSHNTFVSNNELKEFHSDKSPYWYDVYIEKAANALEDNSYGTIYKEWEAMNLPG